MSKQKIEIPAAPSNFKPTADLKLTATVGNFVWGTLKRRLESKMYAGQFTYIIQVENLKGETNIFDKATQESKPIDVSVGDDVFVKGTTRLNLMLKQVQDGQYVEIEYLGKGKAGKGRQAPHLFDVSVGRD